MTSELPLSLSQNPIIEAVVEFHCTSVPPEEPAAFAQRVHDLYADRYPRIDRIEAHHLQVEAPPTKPPTGQYGRQQLGVRLTSADGLQMVQVRRDGFFFNRLAPYDGFDTYLPEIRRCWEIYVSLLQPSHVGKIALRYINRLQLEAPGGLCAMGKYLRLPPHSPPEVDGLKLTLGGFVNQQVMIEENSGARAVVVLATEQIEREALPVILDTLVEHDGPYSVADWSTFDLELQRLRRLKNHVFQSTLTDDCLGALK